MFSYFTFCNKKDMTVFKHRTNGNDQLHLIFCSSNSKPLYRKNVSTSLDNINECYSANTAIHSIFLNILGENSERKSLFLRNYRMKHFLTKIKSCGR